MKSRLRLPYLLFLFFAACFCALFLTGCDSEKPQIAFSSTPFSKELGYTPQNIYKKGERVYFLLYNPKDFKTRLLKINVFRKDPDADEYFGYESLYNKTIELTDKKFYTDYYIMNKKGIYIFQIFEYTNIHKPVIIGIVRVED